MDINDVIAYATEGSDRGSGKADPGSLTERERKDKVLHGQGREGFRYAPGGKTGSCRVYRRRTEPPGAQGIREMVHRGMAERAQVEISAKSSSDFVVKHGRSPCG